MRITPQLIANSLSYINPIGDRELDLRGHQIPQIENMGLTGDYNTCIDFTDNEIVRIANFPLNPRLSTLIFSRNRITYIDPKVTKAIPNLHAIILAQNNIRKLGDLEPLAQFPLLDTLVVVDNPVAADKNYRLYLIWRLRSLRFLDYQRIRDNERVLARQKFGPTVEKPTAQAKAIMTDVSDAPEGNTFEVGAGIPDAGDKVETFKVDLTPEERQKIAAMARQAKDISEINRLEQVLNEGKIPRELLEDLRGSKEVELRP
ncbi:small nuclear ribonucleoprotein U2, A [Lineolata rhizophorae]|uniref:U2 small nuclear ribonucleoprotein A' n=1 Tax=Lineolata rhizophorae TaxID=578093 RepID=A0A6A6P5U5_9PEZI|nr:small nuclear ribonucleoprotein U2, A [Lineolata rhizophorae]